MKHSAIKNIKWSLNLVIFFLVAVLFTECVKYEKNCPRKNCPAYKFCNWTKKSCEDCSLFCTDHESLCQSVVCRDYSLHKMWTQVFSVGLQLMGVGGSLILLSVLWYKIKSVKAAQDMGIKLTSLFEPKERSLDDVQL